jgi:hypothetical protein
VALRDEQRAINQSAQTPEQKAAQYKNLQERARGLVAEFANIKAQNGRELDLEDGRGGTADLRRQADLRCTQLTLPLLRPN